MKFFIDTADITEIRDAAASGLVDGEPINPSLTEVGVAKVLSDRERAPR